MIRHRLLCLGYFDFGSVGLFSLGFLSLFAVQTQHGQNTAADEQSSQPTDEVAAVTGLRRLGRVVLSGLIGVIITATCIADAAAVGELGDDRILAALSAANGAFLVLDAGGLLGSGLVDHPLEAVCCRVGLVATLTLMPVIGVVILPICAIAVGMCCGDRYGFKHLLADGTLLMLQAGLRLSRRFVYLPHEGVGRQILCAAARIRAGAVGALMPMALCVRIPRTTVGMGMGTHIRLHGDGLVGLDITAAAAIVILCAFSHIALNSSLVPS